MHRNAMVGEMSDLARLDMYSSFATMLWKRSASASGSAPDALSTSKRPFPLGVLAGEETSSAKSLMASVM